MILLFWLEWISRLSINVIHFNFFFQKFPGFPYHLCCNWSQRLSSCSTYRIIWYRLLRLSLVHWSDCEFQRCVSKLDCYAFRLLLGFIFLQVDSDFWVVCYLEASLLQNLSTNSVFFSCMCSKSGVIPCFQVWAYELFHFKSRHELSNLLFRLSIV